MDYLTDADYERAKARGLEKATVYNRVYTYGWSIERAITQPVTPNNEWARIAESNGIHRATFHSRIKNGWEPEEAATKKTRKLRKKELK